MDSAERAMGRGSGAICPSVLERVLMYTMPQDPAVILVVDEDALTLTAVAAKLEMAGYECHSARHLPEIWFVVWLK